MKTLFTLTLCTVLVAGMYLVGCDTTTISNGDIAIGEQVGEQQSAAKVAKIDICHKRNGNTFLLINIAESAKPAHEAHGDLFPGDAVPGMAGFIFDEDCDQIEEPVVCTDFFETDLTEAELCGGAVFFITKEVSDCVDQCEAICGGVISPVLYASSEVEEVFCQLTDG